MLGRKKDDHDEEIEAVEEAVETDGDDRDEWDELDESRDWREDGPFDIDEVDLEDDEVARLPLGAMTLTPVGEMEIQLQVIPNTEDVAAALVMQGNSALEVAVFAAPASGGLARDIRRELVAATEAEGGHAEIAEGPFGPEVRRQIDLTLEDGREAMQISRVWFVEGPRWLLRGMLLGEACFDLENKGDALPFVEFFKNIVVNRGTRPRPVGDVIPMTLPEGAVPQG